MRNILYHVLPPDVPKSIKVIFVQWSAKNIRHTWQVVEEPTILAVMMPQNQAYKNQEMMADELAAKKLHQTRIRSCRMNNDISSAFRRKANFHVPKAHTF